MNSTSGSGHTPKLEARQLNKYFVKRGEPIEVLRDINFCVAPGEFVAVVGASGCGKTTLLRMADGLESISSGALLVDGKARVTPGPDRGFVFQNDTLLPWRTVLKNIAFGLELQGKPKRESLEQARRFLDVVGLSGFEKHFPHELSGGMRQRANLARTFCIEPELLLMDEPFAALDSQTREIMQSELLRIWERTASGTVLFITHQIDEAIFLADRIIVLTARPGRIKEIIDVPFERPRDLSIKRSSEFSAIYDRIWKMIEEEVLISMGMAGT